MNNVLRPDICVIGAGSGGLSVAAAAAAFGVSVVLIEKGRMGGDCLNYGCVPSKALIAAGKHADAVRHGAAFGFADTDPDIDFRKVADHIRNVIAAIAPNDSAERFTALGVQVIKAEARFKDRRTVIAGDAEICARRFVIATGSSPVVPDIEGLATVEFFTNETIFEQTRRPGHLIVVGGGPVGIELAQAYRRLGSEVTVVEAATALSGDDPELTAIALDRVRADGVTIRERTRAERVERRGNAGISVHVGGPDGRTAIDATHLLIATGRAANIAGLDLGKARIVHDASGIKVSSTLRTSNRRVYAVGDVVAGAPRFTHVANYHAGLVVRALLFRMKAEENRHIIPRVTFTDPEIAHVGLTHGEAVARKLATRILRWPFAENDRAQAERKTAGHIKLVAGVKGEILGASIVGDNAGEMISLWALALSKGMTIRDIAAFVPPYPTMGEIGKRAAITYFATMAQRPGLRKLIRLLSVFG
jgi:pyruvate/2-oxoglutarate dehydrogenase complex dihydrolipoamide dehydrogenase (E3) component